MGFARITYFLFMLLVTVYGRNKDREKENQCTLQQNGCSYRVSLHGTNCHGMVNDGTQNVLPVDYRSEYKSNVIDAFLPEEKQKPTEVVDGLVAVHKLDDLERRLIKMMEALSVRSLRHIRSIRDDLHKMSTSLSLIKAGGTSRRGGRGRTTVSCPAEFRRVGMWNSCYRFSTFEESWHNAREYCSAFGADLVSLDTIKESYILDYLIKSNPGR